MQKAFLRTLSITFGLFVVVFAAEAAVEWFRLGSPGPAATSWVDVNNAKLVDLLSPVARAYNNTLAMLVATIGLAIPLTANMHTPKLISIFFDDWVNRVVLFLMAFGAANVLWVAYLVGPHFAPMWALRLTLGFALFGWALAIPYFFYVIRFLDPSEIITRLRTRAERAIAGATAPGLDVEVYQDQLHDCLAQIGTIIVKSLDRSDRGVALEGVWAFKKIADAYGTVKPQLADATFKVDRHDFVGLSAEAIDMLNETHTWFERKLFTQMHVAFRAGLSKASDTLSSMSDATRVIMEGAHRRGDAEATQVALHTLNSFVRSSIHAKNVHAIYDVFYQYRILARDLREDADVLHDIGHAFHEYAAASRDAGLHFAAQLAAFDLGSITRRAYEAKSPAAAELLHEVIAMPHRASGGTLSLLVVKAKVVLGGFLLENKLDAEAALVREDLHDVPAAALSQAERDLLKAQKTYFELTDRQVDLEYVVPERRPFITTFVASCSEGAKTAERAVPKP